MYVVRSMTSEMFWKCIETNQNCVTPMAWYAKKHM